MIDLLILISFNASKGKSFWNNGDRYEGEWKHGEMDGQGKKSDLLSDSYFIRCANRQNILE